MVRSLLLIAAAELVLFGQAEATPSSPRRILKQLNFQGPSGYVYGLCEGHCSYDWQCNGDLRCHNGSDNLAIPGCDGEAVMGVNYCYNPREDLGDSAVQGQNMEAVTVLGVMGKDVPKDPKFGICQGNCRRSGQCAVGLRCFNLPGQTKIPGCDGEREDLSVNICYDPKFEPSDPSISEDSYALAFVGRFRAEDPVIKFGKCVGDCRNSSDCRGDLECYEEEGSSVPGCLGVRTSDIGYCFDPKNDGMGNCEGDCDSDDDCAGNLICFERGKDTMKRGQVPGCPDKELSKTDFCVKPEVALPMIDDTLLGHCEGDCDSDDDCAGSLVCFERGKDTMKRGLVPGCPDKELSRTDYCIKPEDAISMIDDTLLGHCEGDCDSDDDCAESLVCFHDADNILGQGLVPGCPDTTRHNKILSSVEHCVKREDAMSVIKDTKDNNAVDTLLGHCEGDCESDDDCEGSLVCSTFASASRLGQGLVPGCPDKLVSRTERCIKLADAMWFNDLQEDATSSNILLPGPIDPVPSSKPTTVEIPLPHILISLSFQERRRLGGLADRALFYSNGIDEQGEFFTIVASLLGESIRRLGPSSYAGMMLDVAFVDESARGGESTVNYAFTGTVIFKPSDDSFIEPRRRLIEAAINDVLGRNKLLIELNQSDEYTLQSVTNVDVMFVEDIESIGGDEVVGYAEESSKDDPNSKEAGLSFTIMTLIIVISVVVIAASTVVVGVLLHGNKGKRDTKRKRSKEGSKKSNNLGVGPSTPQRTDRGGGDASPARTAASSNPPENSFETYMERNFPEAWEEAGKEIELELDQSVDQSEISLCDLEQSSVGSNRSNWSFIGKLFGYSDVEEQSLPGRIHTIIPESGNFIPESGSFDDNTVENDGMQSIKSRIGLQSSCSIVSLSTNGTAENDGMRSISSRIGLRSTCSAVSLSTNGTVEKDRMPSRNSRIGLQSTCSIVSLSTNGTVEKDRMPSRNSRIGLQSSCSNVSLSTHDSLESVGSKDGNYGQSWMQTETL